MGILKRLKRIFVNGCNTQYSWTLKEADGWHYIWFHFLMLWLECQHSDDSCIVTPEKNGNSHHDESISIHNISPDRVFLDVGQLLGRLCDLLLSGLRSLSATHSAKPADESTKARLSLWWAFLWGQQNATDQTNSLVKKYSYWREKNVRTLLQNSWISVKSW